MADGLPEELLHVVIRFSASIPDLPLDIPWPLTTTTLSLKCLIREHLPESLAPNRLRLIHAGKALHDATPLSTSLKWIPPPPRDVDLKSYGKGKGKGKAPVREIEQIDRSEGKPWRQRYYIHCAIGDSLTPQELDSEATLAANLEKSLASQGATTGPQSPTNGVRRSSTTASQEVSQGFDRLLSAGFTAAEIANLRAQFLRNLAYTHTADNMPTGTALRELEDRWFDNIGQDEAGTTDTGDIFRADDGGLEDALWGNLIGLFWPIGALIWGLREEGVWTPRMKLVILCGIAMNLLFGLVKLSS